MDQAVDMDEIHKPDIVQALLRQLGGTIETGSEDGRIYELNFIISELKGTLSNKFYKA